MRHPVALTKTEACFQSDRSCWAKQYDVPFSRFAVEAVNLVKNLLVESVQDAVGDLLGDMAGPGMRPINRRQRIMQSRGTRALGESQAATAIAAGPAAPSSQHR